MRISTSMQYEKNLNYLQKNNSLVDQASDKYNSGYKFQTAGESPSGMSSKIKYTAAIDAYTQYKKNATLAADTLSEEETALASMWEALNSVHSRLIQAVDSTNDSSNLDAIAEDLAQIQSQLFDLMNTQNAEGDYIFSGSNSSQQTMTQRSDGTYVCNANGSTNQVQVAPNVYVQVNDSGLNIFQNCDIARTFAVDAGSGTDLDYYQVRNYDDFNSVFKQYHSTTTAAAADPNANKLQLTTDGAGNYTLQVYDMSTTSFVTIAQGEVEKDGTITANGFEFKLNSADIATTATFTLGVNADTGQTLYKDNILNQMTAMIETLRDESLTTQERTAKLGSFQETVQLALDQYDLYRGRVGSREVEMDSVIESDENLKSIKTSSLANITEADVFETASDLIKYQQQLQASQQVFSRIHGTSLFDYI